MADVVHGRVPNGEQIGSLGIAQLQVVYGFFSEFSQCGISVGARSPLFEVGAVRFTDARFSSERMGKGEFPTGGLNGAERFFTVQISAFRKGKRPGLAEV